MIDKGEMKQGGKKGKDKGRNNKFIKKKMKYHSAVFHSSVCTWEPPGSFAKSDAWAQLDG